jgi:hypothetical protein
MKKWKTFTWAVLTCGAADFAAGRSPIPMDPPTPPPCAADGTCYPRTAEWGYYPVRWRAWPGAGMQPTSDISPTPADQRRVSDELGHSEPPPADLEDAAAPPSSPKRQAPPLESPEPPSGAPAGDVPPPESTAPSRPDSSLPDVPLPDDENSLFGPSTEHDPPPTLPRSISSRTQPQQARQAATLPRRATAASQVSTTDPPPAPPWEQSAAL